MALIPTLKESHPFKHFLGIDEQFPELKDVLNPLDINEGFKIEEEGEGLVAQGTSKFGGNYKENKEEFNLFSSKKQVMNSSCKA